MKISKSSLSVSIFLILSFVIYNMFELNISRIRQLLSNKLNFYQGAVCASNGGFSEALDIFLCFSDNEPTKCYIWSIWENTFADYPTFSLPSRKYKFGEQILYYNGSLLATAFDATCDKTGIYDVYIIYKDINVRTEFEQRQYSISYTIKESEIFAVSHKNIYSLELPELFSSPNATHEWRRRASVTSYRRYGSRNLPSTLWVGSKLVIAGNNGSSET